MQTSALIGSILLIATSADSPRAELESPKQVIANGQPIDIQREGQAAPFFGDIDGDGLNDLLVGEAYGGRLRVYRNLRTKQDPKFGDYNWLRAGDDVARVTWTRGGYKGFTPQLVDLDGDGKTDIVSGSYFGELFWFRRIDGMSFAPRMNLVDTNDKPIRIANGATPSCADWDGDGDIDIVVGTLSGDILLLENKGKPTSPRFALPVAVTAGGKPIKSAFSPPLPAPCVADWNGDGRLDLLIADLDGSVILYVNHGTRAAPQFNGFSTLVGKSPVTTQEDPDRPTGRSGMTPAICVADFNGDGLTDLILGDGCGRFHGEPHQLPAERRVAKQMQARLDQLGKKWAEVFQKYRELSFRTAAKSSGPDEKIASQRQALQAEMERLNGEISTAQLDVQYDWPRYQTHGFVWVFLRRPASAN